MSCEASAGKLEGELLTYLKSDVMHVYVHQHSLYTYPSAAVCWWSVLQTHPSYTNEPRSLLAPTTKSELLYSWWWVVGGAEVQHAC